MMGSDTYSYNQFDAMAHREYSKKYSTMDDMPLAKKVRLTHYPSSICKWELKDEKKVDNSGLTKVAFNRPASV